MVSVVASQSQGIFGLFVEWLAAGNTKPRMRISADLADYRYAYTARDVAFVDFELILLDYGLHVVDHFLVVGYDLEEVFAHRNFEASQQLPICD
jgi:hypothetical protein